MFQPIYMYACDHPGCKEFIEIFMSDIGVASIASMLEANGWKMSYYSSQRNLTKHLCPRHAKR